MSKEEPIIKNRYHRWESESGIRAVLYAIQTAIRLRDLLNTDELDNLIYFALAQFPAEEYSDDGYGDTAPEYEAYQEGIPDYTIDEFYERAINLKGLKKDD